MGAKNGYWACDRCLKNGEPADRVESDIIDLIVCKACGTEARKLVLKSTELPAGYITVTSIIQMI